MASSGRFELDDSLLEGLTCDFCRQQPAWRRLRMETCVSRALEDLRLAMQEERLPQEEARELEAELRRTERVLAELQKHRSHTPFLKVVARGERGFGFVSVYDGCTPYAVGERSSSATGGCFV